MTTKTKEVKESAIIECVINWAFLGEVSGMSGKYQFDASNISDADQAKLVAIGLGSALQDDDHAAKEKKWKREGKFTPEEIAEKMETMPEKGTYIIPKSQIKAEKWREDDTDTRWFTVNMADKGEVDLGSIGNGTRALVKIEAVPYSNKFGTGISVGLAKVVITNLVKYEKGTAEAEDDAEMFLRAAELSKASAKEELEAADTFDYNEE